MTNLLRKYQLAQWVISVPKVNYTVERELKCMWFNCRSLNDDLIFVQIGVWFSAGDRKFLYDHLSVLGDSMDHEYRNMAEMGAHSVVDQADNYQATYT